MMTVRELINWLEDFDDDATVVIGMRQRYGTDFAMEIETISVERVDAWDNGKEEMVVLTEGNQMGGVMYDGDEDDDEEWDDEED